MTKQPPALRPLAVGDSVDVTLPIRWGDMDALNHLNNTAYFRLMEEARVQIFHRSGTALPSDGGIVLAHASCDFLLPIVYPALVCIHHVISAIGRSSMTIDVEMYCEGSLELRARGRCVVVWVDRSSGQSQPWPGELLGRLGHVARPALSA